MTVYLDHAATTPMRPESLAAFTDALRLVGNPSSIHSQGQAARRMLEQAREQIAASVGADPIEVLFTSGGTEAVNLGVKGLYWSRRTDDRRRILVPRGEHHATLDAVEWLAAHEGAVIDWVPLDDVGRIDVDALESAIGPDVALITVIAANNEVGTLQPVDRIVRTAAAAGIPVHADAVSAYGHVPIDFHGSGLAAMSISAHKIGGPLGIGALVLARAATVEPLIHGGGQQRRLRSGTQDAPAAAAFAAAAGLAPPSLAPLRDRVIEGILGTVPGAVLRGDPVHRLDGNAHFTFSGCEGDSLLFLLDMAGFSVSTGSACQAGVPEPSHVLRAMGLDEQEARGALRVTVGADTTESDVDAFLAALPGAVERARRAGFADRVVLR